MDLPLSEITINCFIATTKILILCCGGFYLAHRKILTASEIRSVSKLCQDFFIPALIFSNFVGVNFQQLVSYFPVIAITGIIIFFGIFIGKKLSQYVVKDDQFNMMIPIVCGFAHTINIQLAMTETLGPLLDRIDAAMGKEYELNSEARGIIFTMINSIVNTLFRWSLMTKLIKEEQPDKQAEPVGNQKSELEMKLLGSKAEETKSPKPVQTTDKKGNQSCWSSFQEVLNPPLVIALFSMALAIISPLQDVFVSESSIICQVVTNATKFVGKASSSLLLLMLGANLTTSISEGKQTPYKAIWSITAVKMVFMPVVGFIFLLILQATSIVEDPTMIMVMLVSFGAPIANNILVQYSAMGKDTGQLAKIVLATYLCSLVSLPLLLIIFLSMY